ncbi:MAG: glycosyltransferase family 2 protein [Acidobacteriaceae bacterium]|nr:glycosyltransferase family 2 protein [Acidobacteriaceae bacterium]
MNPMPLKRFALLVPAVLRRHAREHLIAMQVRYVSGPRRIRLDRNEAAVTCVVKNGEFYLQAFLHHYFEMGFRHVFLLDNGSTDRTIAIAQKHANVTVCRSPQPIDTHQRLFKRYLAQHSIEDGWCLDADIDEFFDYPGSNKVPLYRFLEYLNSQGYTAVLTQLLDMFSDKPLAQVSTNENETLAETYRFYDLAHIRRTGYQSSEIVAQYGARNVISHPGTALLWGGIRKRLWNNDCLLTKHSLFRTGSGVDTFPHVHFMNHARLADVSCLMRHYKLTRNALAMAIQNREAFTSNYKSYSSCVNFLERHAAEGIKEATAERFTNAASLLEGDFLFASREYRELIF